MQIEDGQSWRARARCHGADTEIFYPPRDKALYSKIAAQAKVYCLGENGNNPCPVKSHCLLDAIERDEMHGIWGGMSHRERNALVRKWQRKYRSKMTLSEFIFSLEHNKYGN
jgi:WhiB family redox-sensing transcriptional regulator